MTVEEKAAHDALLLEVKSIVTSAMGDTVEKKSFNEALEKLNALEKKESVSQSDFDAIKNEHIQAMIELKALKENATKKDDPSNSLEATLEAKAEDLKNLMERKDTKGLSIEFKAVANMGTGNVTPTTAGGISVLLNDPEAGISGFNRARPFFSTLFPTSPTKGNTVSYAEMVTPEGGAAMTAEGALKSQADFNLEEKSVNVRKVTAFIKTSKESLADIPALAGEINSELLTLVELKADSQILSGDGTGQNLTGIVSVATAFAAGADFANSIAAPNEYDVINVAINQIEIAEVISGEPAGFMPNVIVMNPTDIKKMKLTKTSTGEYVFNTTEGPQVGTQIDSIPVLSNPRMTKGYFLVMDSTKGTIRLREATKIDLGYENDDYTKNLVTILAEKRLAFYVKSQNVKAFVYGNFGTAKTALQA